eukprot:638838-Pleurochrysis_carterae.AAC.2
MGARRSFCLLRDCLDFAVCNAHVAFSNARFNGRLLQHLFVSYKYTCALNRLAVRTRVVSSGIICWRILRLGDERGLQKDAL